MKIFVTGTRGIPHIQGGVETHCENLYPRIVGIGGDVTLIRRSCYVDEDNKIRIFKGVKLKDTYAPRKKSLEAIVHTFLAVIYAFFKRADVIHFHAIGPSIFSPLAKVLGMKVVVTHHGADYEREKWGLFAKFILKTGERMAVLFADRIIVISDKVKNDVASKYGRTDDVYLIYNGVNKAHIIESASYISTLGLESRGYILALGRFVEEKGFHNLIDAYLESAAKDHYPLVIAGDADHATKYSIALKKKAKNSGVILPGMVMGDNLAELYSHARLFVLPTFHEGMPISLLEAMSYNLDVLVSNIPANMMLIRNDESLFNPHDIRELSSKLDSKIQKGLVTKIYDLSDYNWDEIADKTFDVLNFTKK